MGRKRGEGMRKQKLPIGIEWFEQLRRNDFYYVDKTLFIRDLLDNWAAVNLFTRPRRFGKTLLMTTLKAFFERTDADNGELFRGLDIERAGEEYMAHRGRYPVLFVSLKDIAGANFDMARESLSLCVSEEAKNHPELATSPRLDQDDIALYRRICTRTASSAERNASLGTLSTLLHKHHGEHVIILIDEYDVPLDRAYLHGYYDDMIVLMRSFLGHALKSNPSLHFAVLTGCLRISRESMFTGLNNLKVRSILDPQYSTYFGFTAEEVERLLADYGVSDRIADAKAWYDGYRFGDAEVYNPWDILNFCDLLRAKPAALPQSYWVHTSGNDFILRFISTANTYTKRDIERLIDGETVRKIIRQELTYAEIDANPENIWSLLLLTGYVTAVGEEDASHAIPLRIPNAEVRDIYIEKIAIWLREGGASQDLRALYRAVLEGDAPALEEELNRLLLDTISFHDAQESFYQGFLVGLLQHCADWALSSNREAGYGRSDILLEGCDRARAAVIEIKSVRNVGELEAACAKALGQVRERAYALPLERKGYVRVYRYGIAFCGKVCRVEMEER